MSSEKAKSVLSCFGHDRTRRKLPAHGGQERKKWPGGQRNPLKKLKMDKGNQRKSKPFPLIFLDQAWLGFAGFG
jgi:hypothetical protein